MLSLIYFILKYIDKIMIVMCYTVLPLLLFFVFFIFFKTKTEDSHITVIMTVTSILFVNINILGIVLLRKVNKIIKIFKEL